LYNVVLQVKTQYNAVLAAKESEAAARAQLTLAEQQLATSIAKVNAGATTVSDSLRNVVAVGSARLAILQAQNNARSASATLSRYVAAPYLVTAVASDTVDLPRTPIDSAQIMQWALDGPSIRQSQAQIVSVTIDPALKAARDAAQLGMHYAVLSDPEGQTAQLYQAFALPTLFVIDQDGVVRDVSVGFDPARIRALEATVQRLISDRS